MTDQVRASHILLMYDGSMRSTATCSKEAAETQIATLKSELDGGVEFVPVVDFGDTDAGAFPRRLDEVRHAERAGSLPRGIRIRSPRIARDRDPRRDCHTGCLQHDLHEVLVHA